MLSIEYALLATRTRSALWCSWLPSASSERSSGFRVRPNAAGSIRARATTRLRVFFAGSWTKLAYRPRDTLFRNARSPTLPRSTRRSSPSNAPSPAIGSSTSSPRSRAKWFRVPKGMHTNGWSRLDATSAISPSDPSPPAIPTGAPGSPCRASSTGSSASKSTRASSPSPRASEASSSEEGLWSPERGLMRRRPLDSAFDGVQRPGRTDADQMAVRIGEVVDLRAEAGPRHRPPDPVTLEPVGLAFDFLCRELEADRPADLTPAVRIPGEYEEGLLLENEEGAVRVFALVVGRRRSIAQEPGVEVGRPVEVGYIEVDGGDEAAHQGFDFRSAARRRSRAFFLRWRSFRHRLRGRDPRPIRPGSL